MAPEGPSPVVEQTSSERIDVTNPSPDQKDLACKEDPHDASEKKVIDQDEKNNMESNQTSVTVEKDSGFSDTGSDDPSAVEQTDSEDGSTGKSVELEWPGKPTGGTSNAFPSLTPVYILKNVIVQQPMTGHQLLPTQMAWSGPHALDATTGTPRVLIIQQPMVPAASSIWAAKRKPGKRAYQPILKALPRIAPHPGKDGKTESPVPATLHKASTGSSKSKRMRLTTLKGAQRNGSEPELTVKDHETKGKHEELTSSADSKSQLLLQQSVMCNDTAAPSVTDSPKIATSVVETAPLVAHQSHFKSFQTVKFSEAETLARVSRKLAFNLKKQRRFHNTVDVLKRSGLLGITLRTKELISRNKSTQRDIRELKEHTRLLCEAVKSNDSSVWEKLKEAMNFTSHQAEYGSSVIKLNGAHPTDSSPISSPTVQPKSDQVSPVDFELSPDLSRGLSSDLSVN